MSVFCASASDLLKALPNSSAIVDCLVFFRAELLKSRLTLIRGYKPTQVSIKFCPSKKP